MGADDVLALLLFCTLIFLAFCGNILVCTAIFSDRKLRKQPENLFLVSLAISDLFVSLLVMVFAAANDLLGFWPFGTLYCRFWICLDITCCTASILNLCFIAFDRFLHISRPLRYSRLVSRRVILFAILLVWLISGLIGAAQILFGAATATPQLTILSSYVFPAKMRAPRNLTRKRIFNVQIGNFSIGNLPHCHLNLSPFYAVSSSILSFFLPATIMVFTYSKLYLYAMRHVRSIRSQLKQATSLLIMQLASDKICRQVVVHPSYYPTIEEKNSSSNPDSVKSEPNSGSPREIPAEKRPKLSTIIRPPRNIKKFLTVPRSNRRKPVEVRNRSSSMADPAFLSPTDYNCNYDSELINFCESGIRSVPSFRSISDQKARLTLGVIMGIFLVCWLPFFTVNIWRSIRPESIPEWVFKVVTWLGYANSTANPVIYPLFNRDFRRAFARAAKRLIYCFEGESKSNQRDRANFSISK